jgi:hypothetical protein
LVVFLFVFSAQAGLQIDNAYCGTDGAWRDVTPFLQSKLTSNTVSATLEQPFDLIGGDPAPGRGKTLLIDYHYNGKPWRLLLKEEYPTAFRIELPSAAAVAPGRDPLATALMADIVAHPARPMADFMYHRPIFIAYSIAFLAVLCAGIGWFKCSQTKSNRS